MEPVPNSSHQDTEDVISEDLLNERISEGLHFSPNV